MSREPEDRYSEGFLDAVWLSKQVREFYGKCKSARGRFCLPGVEAIIEFLPWPLWLVITFGSTPDDSRIKEFPHDSQRALSIRKRNEQTPWLEHPKRWRTTERKLQKNSRMSPIRRFEFFERSVRLYPDEPVSEDDLALQIFLVLSRWCLIPEPTEADRLAIVSYVMRVCKRTDEEFRQSAEETVSYLFTNWCMPQRATDFRSYAKTVAFNRYRRSHSGQSQPTEGLEDYFAFKRRSQPSKDRCASQFTTARGLAQRIGIHQQRINEAIRKGLLPAIKRRGVYLIAESDAEEYLERTEINRRARNVGKALRSEGKRKEAAAFRKRIYRMKRSDAPRIDLLRVIGDAEAALRKGGAVQAKTAN